MLGLALAALLSLALPQYAAADLPATGGGGSGSGTTTITPCGDPTNDKVKSYTPSIDLGCKGKGNAITDLTFAVIRFLSYGVGLVIIGSMTYAGIQYTGSRGDPNSTAMAIKRIQANVFALLLFLFGFAIVNYLIPGALLS